MTNNQQCQPGIDRVQALADISSSALCCHNNKTRAPIANRANSSQLEGAPTIPPTYIRVREVLWECGEEQTRRHTHTDACDQYTFCLAYGSRETYTIIKITSVGDATVSAGQEQTLSGRGARVYICTCVHDKNNVYM